MFLDILVLENDALTVHYVDEKKGEPKAQYRARVWAHKKAQELAENACGAWYVKVMICDDIDWQDGSKYRLLGGKADYETLPASTSIARAPAVVRKIREAHEARIRKARAGAGT